MAAEWHGGPLEPEEDPVIPDDASHPQIWTPDPAHTVEALLANRLGSVTGLLAAAGPTRELDLPMGATGALGSGRLTLLKLAAHLLNTNHAQVQV